MPVTRRPVRYPPSRNAPTQRDSMSVPHHHIRWRPSRREPGRCRCATGLLSSPDLVRCPTRIGGATIIVPCSSPHLGEIVGTQPASSGDGAAGGSSSSDPESSCAQLTTALTGAVDPSFGGELRVVVLPGPGQQLAGPLSADTGVYYTSEQRSEWVICAIESAVDRRLLDSVARYAGRPLPLE